MTQLPEWIYFNGSVYYLLEKTHTVEWEGWYSFIYTKLDDDMPPDVTDGKSHYYLVSMDISKERAYNDMLDRINRMKPWLL